MEGEYLFIHTTIVKSLSNICLTLFTIFMQWMITLRLWLGDG